ncbi:MAG: gephyrin-like molybdotransferase Glp [Gammaproteobacteria bacterium]|nr:gephyrin-like molybdotransferase Glp [Gammaproteobacteria bacterium]
MSPSDTIRNATPSCADPSDPGALGLDEARRRIAAAATPVTGGVRVALRSALGRVLDAEVVSPQDVPNHTNSAVDGYALAGSELPPSGTREFRVAGTAMAGAPFTDPCASGECVRIMTGAPMPAGTDTVVMQEHVDTAGDGRMRIDDRHRPGQNVRQAGEDIAAHSVVLPAGRRLTPADLGVIASLGLGEVTVRRPVRVAFFSTGDELRAVGDPLGPGDVYDSNRYTLYGMLARLGVEILDLGVVRDSPEALARAFTRAAAMADVVITSGGVSVGEADHIAAILGELGRVEFRKLAMKPGRPFTFGHLGDTLFFGLPGNPVAVMVTFYLLVQPTLGQLAGAGWQEPLTLEATSTDRLRKRPGRFECTRGILDHTMAGGPSVAATGSQGSGLLTSMSRADCLILLPESRATVEPGDTVTVAPFAALI